MKLTWTKEDRNLRGPGTYEKYNAFAKLYKKRYSRLLGLQLLILLAITLTDTVDNAINSKTPVFAFITLTLILAFGVFQLLQYRANYMNKWQLARFVAESTLTEAWLFFFKFPEYSGASARAAFVQRTQAIRDNLRMPVPLTLETVPGSQAILENEFPNWMTSGQTMNDEERIRFYLKERIDDQIRYYTNRMVSNSRLADLFFYTSSAFNISGVLLTVLALTVLPDFNYVPLFSMLAASMLSWMQTKQYEEILSKSTVAASELERVKNHLSVEPIPSGFVLERLILDTEKLISREHKAYRK